MAKARGFTAQTGKEPNNTVLARRVSLDLTPTGFGDRHSAVKLPTHVEQEAEDRQRNSFLLRVPSAGFEPATSGSVDQRSESD